MPAMPRAPSPALTACLDALRTQLGAAAVHDDADSILVYESDGSRLHDAVPEAVVFPRSAAQVAQVVRACVRHGVPYVGRGAGTGLSGGAMAHDGGVVVALNRMNKVLRFDAAERRIRVEPGVRNLDVTRHVAPHGLYYAPDPSSQAACTIGGNVAHNSGGPHTLKDGVTVNHLLGVQVVTPQGEIVEVGGDERPGYDLLALLAGSEGTLGLVTAAELKLLRTRESVRTLLVAYPSVEHACEAVSAIIGSGLLPCALELLDVEVVDALTAAFGLEFPDGAGALLLIETDGPLAGMKTEAKRIEAVCKEHGALSVRLAADDAERAQLWKARKQAFGALGRIARHYSTQDGVIPRTRLPEMLRHVREIAARHELRVANVFHAGDGNLHPCLLYDDESADTTARVVAAGQEILARCLELGGTLSGEHGVGIEKREAMAQLFDATALEVFTNLRAAFDPTGLCNPGKVLPLGRGCGEVLAAGKQVSS